MAHLGERLKKERERRGLALAEVHEATKIQPRYLDALEKRDWAAFPGEVFLRGYLRTYADYLKLDPEQVLRSYARERRLEHTAAGTSPADAAAEQEQAVRAVLEQIGKRQGVDLSTRRRRFLVVAVGSVATVACAVAVWGALRIQTARPDVAVPERPSRARATEAEPALADPPQTVLASRVGVATTAEPLEAPGPRTPETPAAPPRRSIAPARSAPLDGATPPTSSPGAEPGPTDGAGTLPASSRPAQPLERPQSARPAPEATASPSAADEPSGGPGLRLSVTQHGVGTGVSDHRLVGANAEFAEGSAVWFWTLVAGGRPGDQVRHVWIHEGRRVGVIRLRVGGPQWRTQSRRVMAPGSVGNWIVEARDPTDQLLASSRFRVTPGAEIAR